MSTQDQQHLQRAVKSAQKHLVQPWPSAKNIGDEVRGMINSGNGGFVEDAQRGKLIDGPAGMWCTNAGDPAGKIFASCEKT